MNHTNTNDPFFLVEPVNKVFPADGTGNQEEAIEDGGEKVTTP